MESTSTIRKSRPRSDQNGAKKILRRNKKEDNYEKDVIVKEKSVPKKPKKITEDEQRMFISSLDPYDVPLKWWETEHVKYAINYPPVKSRLEKAMGTHIVRLTDHKYMILIGSNMQKDHEEQQKNRIEGRKLAPPSVISQLLKVYYKALAEGIHQRSHNKIKLYV